MASKPHQRAWYLKNRARILQDRKKYRAEHADRIRRYQKAKRAVQSESDMAKKRGYYQANKERILKQRQQYYLLHGERLREKQKAWYNQHKSEASAYHAEYRKEHAIAVSQRKSAHGRKTKQQRNAQLREQYRRDRHIFMSRAQRRAAKKKSAGILTLHDWMNALERYSNRCAYCESAGRMTQEHVTPLSKKGRHDASNVVPACRPCNCSKRTLTLGQWMLRGGPVGSVLKREVMTQKIILPAPNGSHV